MENWLDWLKGKSWVDKMADRSEIQKARTTDWHLVVDSEMQMASLKVDLLVVQMGLKLENLLVKKWERELAKKMAPQLVVHLVGHLVKLMVD